MKKNQIINNFNISKLIKKDTYKIVCIIEEYHNNKNNTKYFCKQCIVSNAIVINMLKNEVLTLMKLRNIQNIPKLYDYSFNFKECYVIYDYIDGINVNDYALSLSLNDKIQLMINILKQIENIHNLGIIHCDLKPSNILIDKTDKVYITDFEISSRINTNSFPKYGSFSYCSIEQLKGEICTYQTDIYSLGIILYEIISEKLFFNGTKDEILKQKINNYIPVTGFYKIDNIIKKATTKNLNERYQNVSHLKNDLQSLITNN